MISFLFFLGTTLELLFIAHFTILILSFCLKSIPILRILSYMISISLHIAYLIFAILSYKIQSFDNSTLLLMSIYICITSLIYNISSFVTIIQSELIYDSIIKSLEEQDDENKSEREK